jgi:hypothetical protein
MGGSGAESPGSQSGKGKRGEVAAKMKLWGGGAGSKGGGIKGRVGLDRLEEEAQAQGQTLEILPTGFKLKTDELESEVSFYPGFEVMELPAKLDKSLGLEILKSPGLQRVILEETEALTILKRLWRKWQQGQDADRLKSKTFTEYVGRKKYRVSTDRKTPITEVIAGFDKLSPKEQARALLATSEPELLAGLPEQLKLELEQLLDEPNLVAKSLYLEEAKRPLIARVNQRLGNQIGSLEEFESLAKLIRQEGTKGTIGETFARRFVVSEQTGSEQNRKPYFPKESYGGDKSVQPDMLRPQSRRTLDVKVGYSTGDIDDDQLDRYVKLIRASRQPENVKLRESLLALGVTKVSLNGHDYLFLSDGKGKAEEAALKAYKKISRRNKLGEVGIYYVANYTDPTGQTKLGIFTLELDEERELSSRLIGERLPD